MKMRSLMLLVVAAGCGLVAMLGMMQILNNRPKSEPMVKVLVATTDIPPGKPLDESVLEFKEFPESVVPTGAISEPELALGKPLISRAVPGEVILEAKLGGADSVTVSHQIPKGMRMATVSVDATSSHSGLIRPTDRVDVICTYKVDEVERRQATHVKTVLEYIEVLAVDSMHTGREGDVDTSVKNVSLIVTPEQDQMLKAASQIGTLSLSLRNRDDKEQTNVAVLSDSEFFELRTSSGDRAKEETKSSAPIPAASVNDFLTSVEKPIPAAPAPQDQAPPTWRMKIGHGETLNHYEVFDDSALPEGTSVKERLRMRNQFEQAQAAKEAGEPVPTSSSTPVPPIAPAPTGNPAADPLAAPSLPQLPQSAPAGPGTQASRPHASLPTGLVPPTILPTSPSGK